MKILIVTTWLPTTAAPTSGIFIDRDIRALSRVADVRVLHLVSPTVDDGTRRTSIGDVPVLRLPMAPTNPLSVARAARQIRALLGWADLLHTMAVSTLVPMALLRPRLPWVHTEHWSGFAAPRSGIGNLAIGALGRLLARPSVVCAVSDDLAGRLRDLGARRVEVVPNIVESAGAPQPMPKRDGRHLHIVGVGGLIPRKQPLATAAAAQVLVQRGYTVELTWIGDGPLAEDLRAAALAGGVTLHMPGVVPAGEIAGYMAETDVFMVPSTSETFFLGAAEALAAGRPVVTGDNGGQKAFVTAPFGAMVGGEDPQALADAALQVVEAARAATPEEIAGPIRQRYSAEELARRYMEIYSALVNEK